jgi:hypothetical protein
VWSLQVQGPATFCMQIIRTNPIAVNCAACCCLTASSQSFSFMPASWHFMAASRRSWLAVGIALLPEQWQWRVGRTCGIRGVSTFTPKPAAVHHTRTLGDALP